MANVHKDFHGALSFGLTFLEAQYGETGMRAFLGGLADTVYKPLREDLRTRGLTALEEHWRSVFDREQGSYDLRMDGETLVLTVLRCPAISHMREHGYPIAEHYCEHTRIVNEAICAGSGVACSVDYEQQAGYCVQRFWRK
jgi:hypothetical protein